MLIKKIILIYSLVALVLTIGFHVPLVDVEVPDYEYEVTQVRYDREYYESYQTTDTEVFNRLRNVCRTISKFGTEVTLTLHIETGWNALDNFINFFTLPISFVYNLGKLAVEVISDIINTEIHYGDLYVYNDVNTIDFSGNDFSSGTSYGGGGGGWIGGR